MRQLIRTRPATVIALVAALTALAAVIAVPVFSIRAQAATVTALSVDFEDGTYTGLEPSGVAPEALTVIDNATGTGAKVLQVSNRANNYDGVSTTAGLLSEGTEYTVSLKVRLAPGESTARQMRLVETAGYQTVGSAASVTADAWTTLSGTITTTAAGVRVYIGSDPQTGGEATYSYLVDDVLVTSETEDEPEPEPCEPLESLDFEGASIAPWLANGATVEIVADPADGANSAAEVSERVNGSDAYESWRGIQSATGAYDEGVEYTFSARVRTPVTSEVRFVAYEPGRLDDADELQEYHWIGNTTAPADTWTTVTGTFTFEAGAPSGKVSIEVAADADYLVDDIVVTYDCEGSVDPEPCVPTVDTVGSWDFESATAPWVGRGAATVALNADAHAGSSALLVTGRTDTWHGTETSASALLTEGTYTISGWVKLPADATGTEDIKITVISNNGTDPVYTQVGDTETAGPDTWVQISGTYAVTNPVSVMYFEAATATSSFLVDDVTVTGLVPCDDEEEPEPCVPAEGTVLSHDFDSTTSPWSGRSDTSVNTMTIAQTVNGRTGSHAMIASGRAATWNGPQLDVSGVLDSGIYTITAWVKLPTGHVGTVQVNSGMQQPGATNESPWVASPVAVGADTWVELTGSYTVLPETPPTNFFIEANDATVDLLVDDFTITGLVPCAEPPPPGTVLLNADFEDATLQGWVPREASQGAHTVAVTDGDSHGGDYAALISDRTSQGSGIGFDVDGLLEPGVQYEMTAWVKFAGSPVEDIVFTAQTGASAFATLSTFTGITNTEWTQVTTKFTFGAGDLSFLYFETPWISSTEIGNTTSFMVDDIQIRVPDAVIIEDLTPIKDTVNFPVGVAIDQRETSGPAADLLLKHFNQITPENFMKPEAWYDDACNWAPEAAEISALMDLAQEEDLGLYGHVLVWHSQTPACFFQDEGGAPLTTSDEDKQILRDRLHEHIFEVAKYLHDGWGEFGGDNPMVAIDVVNEVIDDSAAYPDGMRRSEWYRILGEEFVHLAFEYADDAFNDQYAAASADRPVTLFINDYNTEQSGKRSRYLGLVDRLVDADVPIDGIGHQFHVSLSMPVANLEAALADASVFGLKQAVTELDVTTGTPESEAKFIDQGYYYRDAFEIFRAYEDELFCVTVWGLIDSRSWRDANGGPLVFDDDYQAKPAYYGIVEGETGGVEPPLPAPLRTADIFAGSVAIDVNATESLEWDKLPLRQIAGETKWAARWSPDHLTVFVTVADSAAQATDAVTFTVGANEYSVERDGTSDVTAAIKEIAGGYAVVAHVPLTDAELGDTVQFDVRTVDNATESGWNAEGVLGTLTLVEPLSFTQVGSAQLTPEIDGRKDWIWLNAQSVTASKNVQGSGGALGTFYHLWSENTLYVYAQIADPTVDVSGSDPWTQDSVEIYVDPGNVKNGSFRYDDTQIRINADNVVSFGTGDEAFQANRVESATKRVPGGYIVEVAISLLEDGGLNTFQGVDFQVNDAAAGARSAIRNWADPTGAGYQSTGRWGVAQLVAGEMADVPADFPLAEEDLTEETQNCVLAQSAAKQGEQIVIELCPEYAGDEVDAYIYSTPQFLTTAVATGGSFTVTIPSGLAPGIHKIAVYDEDGFLIGWTEITIVLADGSLSDTGFMHASVAILAAALVLAGAASLWARRRIAPILEH